MKRIVFAVFVSLSFIFTFGCSFSKNVLEFYTTDIGKEESFKALVEKFCAENNENCEINIVHGTNDTKEFLRARILKRDFPDIMAIDGDSLFTMLVESDYIVDFSNNDILNNINPSYLSQISLVSGSKKDSVYGIPYSANASGVLCNKEVFEKYSVPLPQTWDELIEACKVFKSNGIHAIEMTIGGSDSWCIRPIWNNLVSVLTDVDFLTRRSAKKTTFSDEYREVLEKYSTLLDYTQGADIFSTAFLDGCKEFAEGKAAMLINGSWSISLIKKFNPDIKMTTISFPGSNDVSKNCVNSGLDIVLAVSKFCKKKELARKFFEFLLRPENSKEFINGQHSFSAVKGVFPVYSEMEGIAKIVEEGKIKDFPDHYYPNGLDLNSILMDFVRNKQKGIPERQNITVTLLNLDKAFDALLNVR